MFLLVNKPKGITSHDVIYRLRKITKVKRIGHAGTLDPNATGLLIVAVGRASTKRLSEFLKLDKEYIAEVTLGEERDTDDAEGEVVNIDDRIISQKQVRVSHNTKSVRDDKTGIKSLPALSKEKVEETLKTFKGRHVQIPPSYSAIKLNGKKAYQFARKGISISLASRKVEIYSIELNSYKFPVIKFTAKVSSGTYIRSIARDLGRKLGTFAYLSSLERTQIGKYKLKNAINLDDLTSKNWEKSTFDL